MRRSSIGRILSTTTGLLRALSGTSRAQIGQVDLDTVRAGRFDAGKMWTFEYAPAEYFCETYAAERR
ncbi:MAG: hypothetical protein V3T28_02295 [Gemmatimonadales bacterium]